jgi:hypothetical protein
MNNVSYYFGPYLEIEVRKVKYKKLFLGCINGHRQRHGEYCKICAGKTGQQAELVNSYPTSATSLIGEEWGDILTIITPPRLFGTGVIIAIPAINLSWLHFGPCEQPEIKEFPDKDQIIKMVTDMEIFCEDIIQELGEHESVKNIVGKAGYVLNMRYKNEPNN